MSAATKLPRDPHVYGLLADFGDPHRLVDAAQAAHREGYRRMDGYAPFPVHGLSSALGFRQTRLPLIVLIGGLVGAFVGFFMQWYTSVIDYPINVGGKPPNSWPAFIIITFEMTILCAGVSAVLGMLALNGLPRPHHPLFNVPDFELASRTHFFLCIEADDPKFDPAATWEFLMSLGATRVTLVPIGQLIPRPSSAAILLLCMLSLALGACDNVNRGMDDEARITPYEPSKFFANGQSDRPLVEGTVARGQARTDQHLYTGFVNGKEATTFPFPITRATLERGRQQYTIFCAVCHNATGDGDGMIVRRGFVRPPSLHLDRLKSAPPGHFYNVITNGWGAMYSYNDRIDVEDRWAIAAYIRVLQISQNVPLDALPAEDRAKVQAAAKAATQPALKEAVH